MITMTTNISTSSSSANSLTTSRRTMDLMNQMVSRTNIFSMIFMISSPMANSLITSTISTETNNTSSISSTISTRTKIISTKNLNLIAKITSTSENNISTISSIFSNKTRTSTLISKITSTKTRTFSTISLTTSTRTKTISRTEYFCNPANPYLIVPIVYPDVFLSLIKYTRAISPMNLKK